MSNTNRDYAIVYDVKNSTLVLSRPLVFYITDKNTSNIFARLVTKTNIGDGVDQYTDIENASNYIVLMRTIKPNDEVINIKATQREPGSIFEFDLTEDFKDIPGTYICELMISTIVNGRQELITSDLFTYEVKRSILSKINQIIEHEDTTVEKLLNDLDATKAELSSRIKDIENEKADKSMIGSPHVAKTYSEMTDTSKIYVYTGSGEGYINGNWYYYNGTSWESGGVYNSQAIGDFSINSNTVNSIMINKVVTTKFGLIRGSQSRISKLLGYDTSAFVPQYGTSDTIRCVNIDLSLPFEDLYFLVDNVPGQVAVSYKEGVIAQNLTYTNIINNSNANFIYNDKTKMCTVNVTQLRKTFTNLVIAVNKNNEAVYTTKYNANNEPMALLNCIGEQNIMPNSINESHIKAKSITKNHIKDVNLVNSDSISSNNYFSPALCENKYGRQYNIETGDAVWTASDDWKTIQVPIGEHGTITFKKPSTDGSVMQCFYLFQNGKVKTNFTTKSVNDPSNVYPYDINEFTKCYEDYIVVDCVAAKKSYCYYLTITYSNDDCLNNVYINYNNSYVPEWLDIYKMAGMLSISPSIDIILPSKYLVAQGLEGDIHYNNIARYYNTDKSQTAKMNGKFKNYKGFAKYTPSSGDSYFDATFRLYLSDSNNASLSKIIRVDPVPTDIANGNKKLLIIGDSYTEHGIYPSALYNLLKDDTNIDVTFLGTRGTSPVRHEGRSGWRAYEYVNEPSGVYGYSGSNAFYNSSTGKFDFSYYMNANGYTGVDIVCINLGTNDLVRGTHNTIDDMLENYNYMVNSIKSYNPNVKIIIGLAGARALGDMENKQEIDNALRSTKALIEEFDNRESDNIYLAPYYLNIDPNNDFNFTNTAISNRNPNVTIKTASDTVHPSTIGYYKIADVLYSVIKYICNTQ